MQKIFTKLGLNYKNLDFFINNVSQSITEIRKESFKDLQEQEQKAWEKFFNFCISTSEIKDNSEFREAILAFCKQFHQDIYAFNLSLTQSRRVKAGKELESIIELIFKACDIEVKKQGIIKDEKGVTKIIDLISPSPEHYYINPEKAILISCKTTLRERWQEVLEEIRGIQGPQIFLITLDDKFSENLLNACQKFNIQLVVLEDVKRNYLNSKFIISLEELLKISKENYLYWLSRN